MFQSRFELYETSLCMYTPNCNDWLFSTRFAGHNAGAFEDLSQSCERFVDGQDVADAAKREHAIPRWLS